MSDIVPTRAFLANRDGRRVGRELSRLDRRGGLEIARIDQEAELQAERLSAIAYVGKRAMHEVTLLSQLEGQLAALVPTATPQLQGISDLTTLAMAEVVSDTVRKVR